MHEEHFLFIENIIERYDFEVIKNWFRMSIVIRVRDYSNGFFLEDRNFSKISFGGTANYISTIK